MLENYKQWRERMGAYRYFLSHSSWDSETEAPKQSVEARAKMTGILSGDMFDHMTKEETVKMFEELVNSELTELEMREVKRTKKAIDKIVKIPKDRFLAYQQLRVKAQHGWEEAKTKNDYSIFKPFLVDLIEINREFVKYYEIDDLAYNVLLDEYEEGMTVERYDEFFDKLKEDYVPFVHEYLKTKKVEEFGFQSDKFNVKKQREFANYLCEVFHFDFERGLMKESMHPFTWHTHSKDVRFTVAYHEDKLDSAIFSAAHELGHALYEQNIDPVHDYTSFSGGTSLGMHESQSRFYENHIARSKDFWNQHLPKLKEYFPNLSDVDSDEFYRFVNDAKASFIRVDADELTYPLHIMIRYEIEKGLFDESIDVENLPEVWNNLVEEYLGIRPAEDKDGLLQDIHWSAGLFGYFPTYALGSAISAQLENYLKNNFDFDKKLKDGDLLSINEWLKENIHQYGGSKSPDEILEAAVGEKFNSKYYIEYLIAKYKET
jgi:carboxypeptidase Taq